MSGRPARSAALILALLGSGCAASGPNTQAASPGVVGSGAGEVVIGNASYSFNATTCLTDEEAVVAQGPGRDGELYFVKVDTAGQVSVAFGVTSGTQDPDDEQPLFQSVEGAVFNADATGYQANVRFVDTNSDAGQELNGRVILRCGPL